MHHAPMHFIYETKVLHPKFFKNKRWLEIGSGNCYPRAKSHSKNTVVIEKKPRFGSKSNFTRPSRKPLSVPPLTSDEIIRGPKMSSVEILAGFSYLYFFCDAGQIIKSSKPLS